MTSIMEPRVLTDVAVGVVTLVLGWLFGRRKNDADIHKIEVDAAQVSIKSLKDTVEYLTKEVKGLRSEVGELKEQNTGLKEEIRGLREQNTQLKELINVFGKLVCGDMSCVSRCAVKVVKE